MRRRRARSLASLSAAVGACLALTALAACDKKPSQPADSGAAKGDAGPAVSASAAPPKPTPTTWTVTYSLAPATMYVPTNKDWKRVKFKNDTEKYVGGGTLSLTAQPDGRVTGESSGPPLGDALFSGELADGGALSATVRRKDPADQGLTGTLTGEVSGDKLEGEMKLAESNAAVVREGKLSGVKKK
jgi:hypothetical protein